MRCSRLVSAPTPSGKSEATSTKKAITSIDSPGWRSASVMSRPNAQAKPAPKVPDTGRGMRDRGHVHEPIRSTRDGRRLQVVMRREEREPAAVEVLREQPAEERLALVVERGERLVERPDRRGIQHQAREADAAALSGRKAARGKVAALAEADLLERGALRIGVGRHTAQGEQPAQVLGGAQVVLDPRQVARIKE